MTENANPTICIADDRITSEPGIRLLIASLARHAPGWPIELCVPSPSPELREWVKAYPDVTLNGIVFEGDWLGYNVKPQLMMAILKRGIGRALWIDSDIIVMRPLTTLLTAFDAGSLILTEEAMSSNHYDGDALRARSWGLSVGRKVPFQLNTGVVGVSTKHLPILAEWRRVLESPEYVAAYRLPWTQRPSYFAGDQEVLTALLCSQAFSDLSLSILKRGRDIVQYFGLAGYSTTERLRHLFIDLPIFIHAQGGKPWIATTKPADQKSGVMDRLRGAGPYSYAAVEYAPVLTDVSWLPTAAAEPARRWRMTAPLSGMGLSLAVDIYRILRWAHTGGEPRKGNRAIATHRQQVRAR